MSQKILFTVSLLLASISQAYADRIPVETQDQLVGCWSLVEMPADMKTEMNEVDPYPQRFQWFCFEADGTLHTVSSSTPAVYTTSSLREAFKNLPPNDMTFEIIKPGIVRIRQASTRQEMGWQTEIFDQTYINGAVVLAKGDVEMGLIDFSKGKVVYWRVLTRLKP